MKLLFVIKHLRGSAGGAERVLCMTASELATRGHDVAITTFDPPGGEAFYPLDSRVPTFDLGIGDATASADAIVTTRRMVALRRLSRQFNPNVAIGFMHSAFVPLALCLARSGIPVVGSEHIVREHYRERPLQYALLVATAPFLKKITVLSEAIRADYPAILASRMVAMPNPVNLADGPFETSAKHRRVLLNVGRLEPQKNQATLIHAFSLLAEQHSDWDLRIVGEGMLGSELRSLASSLGLGDRVQFPGLTQDIASEYRSADVFAISSRYESFGLATAEAMSFGLPVVGFADCPGTNALVEDGFTGLLAPGNSDRASSLACSLGIVMSRPALRRQLGEAGQAAIKSRYSLKQVVDMWEALLAGICAQNRPEASARTS